MGVGIGLMGGGGGIEVGCHTVSTKVGVPGFTSSSCSRGGVVKEGHKWLISQYVDYRPLAMAFWSSRFCM